MPLIHKKPKLDASRNLSERCRESPHSMMAQLVGMAAEHPEIINFGPGEPNFPTPKHIIEKTKQSLDQGFTHYAPPEGMAELKKAIAEKLRKENKISIHSPHEQIVVTTGSTEAMLLATMCLVDAGEEAIIPNPSFLAYVPTIEMANGFAQAIPLHARDGFQLSAEEISKAVSEKTRCIVLCTPSNPTGTVLKRKVLEEVADVAIENNLVVLSDEAYEHFVYDGAKHVSMASLNGLEDRVLTMQSFSKTYAMAGFRIGYAAGPPWLVEKMTQLHVYSTLASPTIGQRAALHALQGPQDSVKEMRDEYNHRRKALLKRIREVPGLHVEKEPEGAFYIFPKFDYKMTSFELCRYLIREAKVLTVPGKEFGRYGEGFIRFSYSTTIEKIGEGMDRVEKALRKLKR